MSALKTWPLPTVKLSCKTCGTETEYETEGLRMILGDQELSQFRQELTADCEKGLACHMIFVDALLVDTILERDLSKVIDPKLLPQAREWRAKLGLQIEEFGELRR